MCLHRIPAVFFWSVTLASIWSTTFHGRLILRTHELALSPGRLAAFLQIPEESIDLGNAHLNRAGGPGPAERLIDRTYLAEMVDAICRDNMSRFFPDPNADNT